jgi:hypothetical protein
MPLLIQSRNRERRQVPNRGHWIHLGECEVLIALAKVAVGTL